MRIDPLETWQAETGAIRPVTPSLLAEVYLAPRVGTLPLASVIDGDAPWSASHAAAPAETEAVLLAALRAVALGSSTMEPAALRPESLPASRARDHLAALRDLWERAGGSLPEDLAPLRHLLGSDAADALEPLVVVDPEPCPFAAPAERAVQMRLADHHGVAMEAARTRAHTRRPGASATAAGALGHLQANLVDGATAVPRDRTVAVWGLRDPVEEASLAAALVQRMLDAGEVAAPSDVGLLAPAGLYPELLGVAFDAAGIPLSGMVEPAPRHLATELFGQVLRLLEGPGARMALAATVVSPLMPWPASVGSALARQLMAHGTLRPDPATAPILGELRPPIATTGQLFARLATISGRLAPERSEDRAAFVALVNRLRATQAGDIPDWNAARRVAEARHADGPPDRFVEGASLFDAAVLPWRRCRRMIVLGLAGDAYPLPVAANPMFLDREKLLIREATGLWLPTRGETLSRRLELFRRQLCAASEAVDLLVPALDARGGRLAPSMGLALIARGFGLTDPARLVTDFRGLPAAEWPVPGRRVVAVPNGGRPDLPRSGVLDLGTDLIRLRRDAEGRARPQSPSRLNTMLVSPLAWVLNEMDLQHVPWQPEALDALTLGNLAHHVLEHAFPAGRALPSEAELAGGIDALVAAAVARQASWLAAPGWEAERASLTRALARTVQAWRRRLAAMGAEVLANELVLAGDGHGLLLSGRADCLLQLGDGRLVVVDHKRSSSRGREERMKLGWDLQVELYRAMLARPSGASLVPPGAPVATAYHCLVDDRMLSHGLPDVPGVDDFATDVSAGALAELRRLAASLGAGRVPLGRAGDRERFRKERGMTAYVLDDAFVAAFALPERAGMEAEA
jgi:RecB family exonuclease